ncbi:protein PHLOEM PROTEIN 2-LIKE A9-like [Olea europaea var. sylvestris]|uniref:Protein PHLOEM PROTEIN 2-LIKE A9-like n=1 Tax=Olea europaea subsp. europaea TaxID=158383 RepID=A0A8S0TWY6_OLEEU|nr:protein PHLOEM PROTEIN 2-LIKE A9-like [Olea europaea var. sylvestris]CAA3010767.1 Hypothetical predicted protein [Olea europaea subsp. europaea]
MPPKNPHHEGNNNIELDQSEKEIKIQPEDLNIIWGEDNRYWNIKPGKAELLQVCWLEVTGSVRCIDPKKSYRVSFNVSFMTDAFGWGVHPLYLMLKAGKDGKVEWKKIEIKEANESVNITGDSKAQTDSTGDSRLYFGLYEVWSGKWKGGLEIHHVIVKEVQ